MEFDVELTNTPHYVVRDQFQYIFINLCCSTIIISTKLIDHISFTRKINGFFSNRGAPLMKTTFLGGYTR